MRGTASINPSGSTPAKVSPSKRSSDQAERGAFFCVGTLRDPTKERSKENIAETSMLHADIDFKLVNDSRTDVERRLKALEYPPSVMVFSGNGVHAYWLLKESIVNPAETSEVDRIEAYLRQLCDVVGGDAQVCEIARVMRLPGTHNTKNGERKPVEIIHAPVDAEGRLIRYEISDLEEWLAMQSPVILRKVRPRAVTVGQAIDNDPHLAYAKEFGFKPPIDVAKRLDEMMFMAMGDASVHKTQLSVTASLMKRGEAIDDVVELVLAATKAAAGDYGKRWNWQYEKRSIRDMCETALKKYPPTALSVVRRNDVPRVSGTEPSWEDYLIVSAKGVPKPLLANAITMLRYHPDWSGVLSYNEFALLVSVDKAPPWFKSTSRWSQRPWAEHDDLLLTEWLQHQDVAVNAATAAQAVETVARDRSIHPVLAYLDGLEHDGTKRVETWLTDFLGVEDSPYTRAVGQAMLIAAVARIRNPGCKVDNVPILESDKQGKLKSTAIKTMFYPWFSDELADLGSKDAAMQTSGVWGIEMSELDSMFKSEVSKAKAFITRTTDRFRPPYGRRLIESKRSCVFWGTTNQDEYLKDETGGRRFWPLKVGTISIEGLKAALDQLWAEAQVLYAAGTPWWIVDASVKSEAEQSNRQVSEKAWDELVADYTTGKNEVTVINVLRDALFFQEVSRISQSDQNRVVRCLKMLGFKKVRAMVDGTRSYSYRREMVGEGTVTPLKSGPRPGGGGGAADRRAQVLSRKDSGRVWISRWVGQLFALPGPIALLWRRAARRAGQFKK
jgi:hypothetical protein